MSNFTVLTTITMAALFTVPAFAQDAPEEAPAPAAEDVLSSTFTSADLNQDERLTADEFVSFAVMRGHDGDEDFKILVLSGEYDTAFSAHDTDGSGSLEISELQAKSEPSPEDAESDAPMPETEIPMPGADDPDLN